MILKRQLNTPFTVASTRWVSYFSIVLVGLIGILPFLNMHHARPLVSFHSEWLAILLGMAAGIVLLSRQFWLHFSIPHSASYMLALALLAAIQSLLVPRPYAAQWLYPALYLNWAAWLTLLGGWLRHDLGKEKVTEALAWFIVFGGLFSAFTGLVQHLGFGGWLGEYVTFKQTAAIHGNIAQANHFAAHLLLATTGLCYLFATRRVSMLLAVLLLAFFAFIAGLSASRAVFLYATALCLLPLAGYLRSRDRVSLRLCAATAFFLVTYIGIQYVVAHLEPWPIPLVDTAGVHDSSGHAPTGSHTAIEKLATAPSGLATRLSEWRKGWRMFVDSPLLGVGVGNYAWHSFSYQSHPEFSGIPQTDLPSHSHNLFVQVLAEMGIGGFALLLALLIGWVKQIGKDFSTADWFIAGSLLIIFIHSNLEFPLWYSYFLGIAAFLIGLGDSRPFLSVRIPARFGQLGGALLLASGFIVLISTLQGFGNLAHILRPYSVLSIQEKREVAVAAAGNPLLAPYAERLLVVMMRTNTDDIEEKLAVSTRLFRRNPDAYATYRQSTFLALNDHVTEAQELLQKAALVYPTYLPSYIRELKRATPTTAVKQLADDATRLLQNLRQKE